MNDKDLDRHILIHAPINLHQVDSPLEIADDLVDFAQWSEGALIGALMDPVSCVSCVSWMYCVNAAETHETFHQESGMRYQTRLHRPDLSSDRVSLLPAPADLNPIRTLTRGHGPRLRGRSSLRCPYVPLKRAAPWVGHDGIRLPPARIDVAGSRFGAGTLDAPCANLGITVSW
jgi:hypothetical protein